MDKRTGGPQPGHERRGGSQCVHGVGVWRTHPRWWRRAGWGVCLPGTIDSSHPIPDFELQTVNPGPSLGPWPLLWDLLSQSTENWIPTILTPSWSACTPAGGPVCFDSCPQTLPFPVLTSVWSLSAQCGCDRSELPGHQDWKERPFLGRSGHDDPPSFPSSVCAVSSRARQVHVLYWGFTHEL